MAIRVTRYIKNAENFFAKRDYTKALFFYSLALKERPENEEAKLGAMLADMASDMEDQAQALFDYYIVMKKENPKEAKKIVNDMITTIDSTMTSLSHALQIPVLGAIEAQNGILYDDFIVIVEQKKDFKRAFEDVLFSTKIIIQSKEQLMHFLELLIENGYHEIAMNYIENAQALLENDLKIRKLLEKMERKNS